MLKRGDGGLVLRGGKRVADETRALTIIASCIPHDFGASREADE